MFLNTSELYNGTLPYEGILESAHFVEWEEAQYYWADNTAVRYSAETIAGIPGIRALTIVARYE